MPSVDAVFLCGLESFTRCRLRSVIGSTVGDPICQACHEACNWSMLSRTHGFLLEVQGLVCPAEILQKPGGPLLALLTHVVPVLMFFAAHCLGASKAGLSVPGSVCDMMCSCCEAHLLSGKIPTASLPELPIGIMRCQSTKSFSCIDDGRQSTARPT